MHELILEQIRRLADQYLKGTISDPDRALFEGWCQTMPDMAEWAD